MQGAERTKIFAKLHYTEVEFFDEIQTKVLRVFLLAIHYQLYRFALRFLFLQTHATPCVLLQTHTTSYIFLQLSYCAHKG